VRGVDRPEQQVGTGDRDDPRHLQGDRPAAGQGEGDRVTGDGAEIGRKIATDRDFAWGDGSRRRQEQPGGRSVRRFDAEEHPDAGLGRRPGPVGGRTVEVRELEGGHRANRGIGPQDREHGARIRGRADHDLRINREVSESTTRDGCSRGGAEQQDARDQG
jgi:hypothetical protein